MTEVKLPKGPVRAISVYPAHAVFQWTVSNHEHAKAFLGDAYIAVYSKFTGHGAHLGFKSKLGSAMAAPGDYIIHLDSGHFVPVCRELYERIFV